MSVQLYTIQKSHEPVLINDREQIKFTCYCYFFLFLQPHKKVLKENQLYLQDSDFDFTYHVSLFNR